MMVVRFGLVVEDTDEVRWAGRLLASVFQKEVGLPVEVAFYQSPKQLTDAMVEGKCNFAWVSPALFLLEKALKPFLPVGASLRNGSSHYHGTIFVRGNFEARSAEDLKGKTVAWVAKSSASGYIFPRLALARVGVTPSEHFGTEIFAGTHARVAELVSSGEADIGAGYATFNEDMNASSPLRNASYVDAGFDNCRILLVSPPVPADLFVVSSELAAYRRFVSPLSNTIKLARDASNILFAIDDVTPLSPAHFKELDETIESAKGLGIL